MVALVRRTAVGDKRPAEQPPRWGPAERRDLVPEERQGAPGPVGDEGSAAREARGENFSIFTLKSLGILKGKCSEKYFSKILRKCPAEFFKTFSQIFRRESPEISAAWRAAFSARNRREGGVGGAQNFARKTP